MSEFFDPDQQLPTGPRISPEGLSYYKSLLGNEAWVRDNPAQAAMLKSTVDNALALTGQSFEPPSDGRSVAQRSYDRLHAIEPHAASDYREIPETHRQFASLLNLPQNLATLVVEDALSGGKKADAAKVLGERYQSDLRDAEALLQRVAHLPEGGTVRIENLSPQVIAQLAVWSRHLTKAQQTRPKS